MADDTFEAAEMDDGAAIVHRDKAISRRMGGIFAGIGLLPLALTTLILFRMGLANAHFGELAVAVGANVVWALALGLMGIVFSVVRTLVTKKAVHVKYGLWGPTIPLDEIVSARVVPYNWTEFGGWGIRYGRDGSRAYVPQSGDVVEIIRNEGGKQHRVLVGAQDPASVVAAIERERVTPRIAAGAVATRVAHTDAELAEAERELAAEEEEEKKRGRAS